MHQHPDRLLSLPKAPTCQPEPRPAPARAIEADYPPLMRAQAAALRGYAQAHGPGWKRRLQAEWLSATADPLLHRLCSTHGQAWLVALPHPVGGAAG